MKLTESFISYNFSSKVGLDKLKLVENILTDMPRFLLKVSSWFR